MTDRRASSRRKRRGMEKFLRSKRRPDYVLVGNRRTFAGMSEQIAAEQSLGRFFEQNPCFPVVRNVRSIDVSNAPATEIDDLSVGQLAGRSITQIIERDQATECTVRDLRARRRVRDARRSSNRTRSTRAPSDSADCRAALRRISALPRGCPHPNPSSRRSFIASSDVTSAPVWPGLRYSHSWTMFV